MQSYDVFMLLVLMAAAVWGYWKGFVWQLASLASIFFSYSLAFGLRVQVARLIDAPPPWNMFAAMGIVYALSSLVIWIGTGFASDLLATLRLKDFDRQIGATFGVAKGVIFCILITFFAVTLLGEREQARICGSTSGRFIARLLKSSGGIIPPELHATIDPYLTPFEHRLEQHQAAPATDWAQQPPPQEAWLEQGSVAWNPNYAPPPAPQYQNGYAYPQPTYAPPANQYNYPPGYDPRYADPRSAPPAYDPRLQPDPQYNQSPAQDPGYAQPQYANPRYANPDYTSPRDAYPPSNDNGQYYHPAPQYAPQDDPRYYRR